MWKAFGNSIGLLTIAMMAALYSSNAFRQGRMAATGVASVIALGIALFVCFRYVPRLAADVDWEWLSLFSHYHVTHEGWIYFAALTVMVFAAVNTGNNLLYMVLSALLAFLVLSGFLSTLTFRRVQVGVRIPARCFAGEPFPISIQVHNEKRAFPSLSLHFEPAYGSAFRFSAFYVPVVRAGRRVSQTRQALLSKRGRYAAREVKAWSRYPFGFFLKDRNYQAAAECICYPEIIPQERVNSNVMDIQGSKERFERGLGYDLYMIRDYRQSDSARHVHWKASAKTSVLKTREYAAEDTRRIVLAFDRFGGPGDAEKFERVVSYAASLAFHLIKSGAEVALVSDEWRTGHGSSEALLGSILEYLALVEMSAAAGPPAAYAADGVLNLSLRPSNR